MAHTLDSTSEFYKINFIFKLIFSSKGINAVKLNYKELRVLRLLLNYVY